MSLSRSWQKMTIPLPKRRVRGAVCVEVSLISPITGSSPMMFV
jgi:hypothetical protein